MKECGCGESSGGSREGLILGSSTWLYERGFFRKKSVVDQATCRLEGGFMVCTLVLYAAIECTERVPSRMKHYYVRTKTPLYSATSIPSHSHIPNHLASIQVIVYVHSILGHTGASTYKCFQMFNTPYGQYDKLTYNKHTKYK